jgi:hypothetical protein
MNPTTDCYYCKKEIDVETLVCPYCRQWTEKGLKEHPRDGGVSKYIWGIFAVTAILIYVVVFSGLF